MSPFSALPGRSVQSPLTQYRNGGRKSVTVEMANTDRQTYRQTDRQTDRHKDKQTDRQKDIQGDGQTDRQSLRRAWALGKK